MPTIIDLGKKVKAKYPGTYDDLSDMELGKRVKAKYPEYADFTDVTQSPQQKFAVPQRPQDRSAKIASLKQQAATAKADADRIKEQKITAWTDKNKSATGFAGNALKAAGETLASAEVGLGKSMARIFGKSDAKMSGEVNKLRQMQLDTYKKIREKEAKGEDATAFKRRYNEQMDAIKSIGGNVSDLPTVKQVAGQLGGTALDLLTAGTYSKGAKTGQLVKAKPSILPTGSKPFFSKETAKEVLVGGSVGYAHDVTQGLQANEDKPFKPGVGTAIGVGIPLLGRGGSAVAKGRQTKAKDALNIVAPDLTASKKEAALLYGKAEASPTKLFRGSKMSFAADPETIKVAEAATGIVKKNKSMAENFTAVGDEIENIAVNRVKPFLAENKVPFNFEDLRVRYAQIQPSPSLKSDRAAYETYKRVREEFLDDFAHFIRNNSDAANLTDTNVLWDARKVMDSRMERELGEAIFDSPQFIGAKVAARDFRKAFTDFIVDSMENPGQMEQVNRFYEFLIEARNRGIDVSNPKALMQLRKQLGIEDVPENIQKAAFFKDSMEQMRLLYQARENMVPKVRKALGKAKVPLVKTLKTAGKAVGVIGAGGLGAGWLWRSTQSRE